MEKDHPRSRGVYWALRRRTGRRSGSSPLARGLPDLRHKIVGLGRIIPARAGFTTPFSNIPRMDWDHPRSRGVYRTRGSRIRFPTGSSPLARGLLPAWCDDYHFTRIIPARAGFTTRTRIVGLMVTDHPRSRGVYIEYVRYPFSPGGSSPLARGLPPVRQPLGDATWIIPARAGFTARVGCTRSHRWDHPRSRGVYCWVLVPSGSHRGSSPLARGLLPRNIAEVDVGRIIPARAGFTNT